MEVSTKWVRIPGIVDATVGAPSKLMRRVFDEELGVFQNDAGNAEEGASRRLIVILFDDIDAWSEVQFSPTLAIILQRKMIFAKRREHCTLAWTSKDGSGGGFGSVSAGMDWGQEIMSELVACIQFVSHLNKLSPLCKITVLCTCTRSDEVPPQLRRLLVPITCIHHSSIVSDLSKQE